MRVDLAKTDGLTLEEHINDVLHEAEKIIEHFDFVVNKYNQTTGKDLQRRLEGACYFHDEGKKHNYWQDAIWKDHTDFLEWQKKNGGNYQGYKKAMKGLDGKHLRNLGFRHEIYSIIAKENFMSLPIQIAIAAHHSKLSQYHESKWLNPKFNGKGKLLWVKFKKLNNKFHRLGHQFSEALEEHYHYAATRALLQLADRRASAIEGKGYVSKFKKFNYTFDYPKRRPVQQLAERYWQDELLLMRAPTGAGKTDAALLWAKKQIDNNLADRLIIAMPTRFTSNALSVSIAENISKLGLYHSSAWFKWTKKYRSGEIEKQKARAEHEYSRLLLSPVTVCTVDHLLIMLTLTREDHHTIAFNFSNSCLVIDEADFYDEFTQANILVLLEACKKWNVPTMIMSASIPEASKEMYNKAGFNVKKIQEDKSDNNRIRCEIKSFKKYEDIADLEPLLNKCIEVGNAIIYANTVDRAMAFYNWFTANEKKIKPLIYHSRFTDLDKVKKEEELIGHLGKEAWKANRANGVAILTQIGEMSVNISSDLMISDLCPVDRLAQRAGRLCRFDKEKIGSLHILYPYRQDRKNKKESSLHPAPYGSLEKGKWIPAEALIKTKRLLKLKGYTAKNWIDLVNEVYEKIPEFSEKAKTNAFHLKNLFVANWIVGSMENIQKEEEETQIWKSRDIAGNVSVFTQYPDNDYFKDWNEFTEFKNDVVVNLPMYLVEKGIRNGELKHIEVIINDKKEKIYYALPKVYSNNIGLQITNKKTQVKNYEIL